MQKTNAADEGLRMNGQGIYRWAVTTNKTRALLWAATALQVREWIKGRGEFVGMIAKSPRQWKQPGDIVL